MINMTTYAKTDMEQFVQGEWVLNLNRTLDDADYDEGQYIFALKNARLLFEKGLDDTAVSGFGKYLKADEYSTKLKSNDQVVIDVTPQSKKLMGLVTGDKLFNYQQKKIILKKYKKYLIAAFRPSKESGELKLYFSKTGTEYKKRKSFKIKYDTLYENIDDTIDQNLRYVMFFKNNTVTFSGKPFSKNTAPAALPFVNASSKKVFIDEGKFLVVAASKMFRLYKSDEKGKKHYYKPVK
jgi:hypothetical protein